MRRLVWFSVGAGVGALVLLRAREYARRATPQAVGDRLSARGQGLLGELREFTSTVGEAMTERERELRDELGMDDHPERASGR